ncbi:selenocysteine lyase/cysteine desulfurase [Pseudaminobacter salicylatoxidans]|uniref:Selenocysteine lyase/cysteine desulfurase n=1 Tax=Pseudaminobacter salicylatoxidans TaxID=93369 RepID=A0A316C9L3_PSESE|nr:aminotransferase class V-fold PLP-dependent enzyme [Pseudaminobacter salicylatoxidans]PWJ86502.1 selenocysteine lyase/cysteine desulfurase [Pseudaminobacter salicylatoxidans]
MRIDGPFGPRPLVYADYVASGRALTFVEDAVRDLVLPFYGNTHTETSFTGRETTRLREMARAAVRRAVGAGPRHAVIFSGSGATGAIDKLIRAMGLYAPATLRAKTRGQGEASRPVVFVGPYEHHSNDLQWREALVDVERVPLDAEGQICLDTLERLLVKHEGRERKIGAFSAASNVTGIKTDMRRLAALLHRHGALFFCDYAAGAPYMDIDMAESAPGAGDHIDAAFLSPHKFIGGPGASGLLIADRALLCGTVPSIAGGGTVAYVTADHHVFVADAERREEAGTPNIVGDIRAGIALELKSSVGAQEIERREGVIVDKVMQAFLAEPAIDVLGSPTASRAGIFAFNIRAGGKTLHHGFVTALLNDLFGIQARAGCSCAGPYAHDLLAIPAGQAERHEALVAGGESLLRPGWVRLGFNYFFNEETVAYIISAVRFIAQRGADFLPLYEVDAKAGLWRVVDAPLREAAAISELGDIWSGKAMPPSTDDAPDFSACLRLAQELADTAGGNADAQNSLSSEAEALRWFWMPGEAVTTAA